MRKMGKNKAPSVDGMLDTIFQEEEWKLIKIEGEEDRGEINHERNNFIRYNLAQKLTDYLNYILKTKKELPFK